MPLLSSRAISQQASPFGPQKQPRGLHRVPMLPSSNKTLSPATNGATSSRRQSRHTCFPHRIHLPDGSERSHLSQRPESGPSLVWTWPSLQQGHGYHMVSPMISLVRSFYVMSGDCESLSLNGPFDGSASSTSEYSRQSVRSFF
jgi:hypothetical protein